MQWIEDLHFHDLLHEGTTRLFERGYSIQEVAMYTLHDSWAVLKRYTHLEPRGRTYEAPFLKLEQTGMRRAAWASAAELAVFAGGAP